MKIYLFNILKSSLWYSSLTKQKLNENGWSFRKQNEKKIYESQFL